MKSLALIPVFILGLSCYAQYSDEEIQTLDSLEQIISANGDQKEVIKALEATSNLIYIAEPVRDIKINAQIDSLCQIGLLNSTTKEDAVFFNDHRAFALNNGGAGYYYQGDYYTAIEMYTEGLELQEQLENDQGIAAAFNNIGMIYFEMKSYSQAITYCKKGLVKLESIHDTLGIAALYDNFGLIYKAMGDTAQGNNYVFESYRLRLQIMDQPGLCISLNNVGNYYLEQEQFDSSGIYYQQALEISREIQDFSSISTSLNNLGLLEFNRGNFRSALKFCQEALIYAKKFEDAIQLREVYKLLYRIEKKLGHFQNSLEMYELYIEFNEKIESQENQEKVISEAYRYEYEKQAAQDSVKTAEEKKVHKANLEAAKAKNKQKEQESYLLYGGLLILGVIGFFIYSRLRITRKQKDIIQEQKHEVEAQRQEILDSISYAKRIQSAILPSSTLLNEHLPEHFVLYRPKDIVAGDFYWLEPLHNNILFAAADCTGHGVPGAMVSVVCNNGLNRSVREHNLTNPAEILDKTREIVIAEFEKSEEEVKDGMDIALCLLEKNETGQSTILTYAGANNPLWILRKGAEMFEEIKANKQPIGKFAASVPFTSHKVSLHPGDTIYIFTDGYQDQFGGEKEKKFKAANLKKLLLKIRSKSMLEQKEELEKVLVEWMGNLEQIDDVCIIGVRI